MTRLQRTVCWLSGSPGVGAVCGLVASVAPPRLRLIGLFAIGLGAAAGWLSGRLAVSLRMPSQRTVAAGGLLTGVAGVVVVTLLNWQAYARELRAAEKPNAGQALMANMLKAAEEIGASDPESEAALTEFRDAGQRALAASRQRRSFRGFLTHRMAALQLSTTLAGSLWVVETLLAGAVAAAVAVRSIRQPFCDRCDHFLTVSRRHRFEMPVPENLKALLPDGTPADPSAVTVALLRCRCPGQIPRVQLDILEHASGRRVLAVPECDSVQIRELAGLLDEVEGLSAPADDST